MQILISSYSAKLRSGKQNAKNYPYWDRLVSLLNQEGYEVIQIGIPGEARIEGVSQFIQGWPFSKLRAVVKDCQTWISVDNFFPHFCNAERLKSGIVLWGQSDPKIWGYPQNVNLLRGREFLRPFQYANWEDVDYNAQVFVYPENVVQHVYKLAPLPPKALMLTANAYA